MTLRKKIAITIAVGTLFILYFFRTDYVNTGGGGELLWNSSADQAYLFWEVNSRGYQVSYLEYPFQVFRDFFGLPRTPDDSHSYMAVWRITSTGIQNHILDEKPLTFATPVGDSIYANREGTLWKWSLDHFEPVTPEEQQEIGGTRRLSGLNVTDVDGWTTRRELGSPGKEVGYEMKLGGKQIILVVDPGPKNDKMSIDLIRSGQAPQRIWTMGETPRKVSKAEYKQLLGK